MSGSPFALYILGNVGNGYKTKKIAMKYLRKIFLFLKKREREGKTDLPTYLDLLGVCMQSLWLPIDQKH